jgi:hypothetical protein
MGWVKRHAEAMQALSALVTMLVALAALIGVKVQIDASDRAQALQSARGAYLAQQALAVQTPRFAQPDDACALLTSPEGNAYEAFVTHLLFTAEQTLAVQQGWEPTFLSEFAPHAAYICTFSDQLNTTEDMHALLAQFRADHCANQLPCSAE